MHYKNGDCISWMCSHNIHNELRMQNKFTMFIYPWNQRTDVGFQTWKVGIITHYDMQCMLNEYYMYMHNSQRFYQLGCLHMSWLFQGCGSPYYDCSFNTIINRLCMTLPVINSQRYCLDVNFKPVITKINVKPSRLLLKLS